MTLDTQNNRGPWLLAGIGVFKGNSMGEIGEIWPKIDENWPKSTKSRPVSLNWSLFISNGYKWLQTHKKVREQRLLTGLWVFRAILWVKLAECDPKCWK